MSQQSTRLCLFLCVALLFGGLASLTHSGNSRQPTQSKGIISEDVEPSQEEIIQIFAQEGIVGPKGNWLVTGQK
jgi:hypothetical protein